jgi:hypothetical protein
MEDAVGTAPSTTDAAALARDGFVVLPGTFASATAAWPTASAAMRAAESVDDLSDGIGRPLERVGEFVIPPPDLPQRDFQALHVDFGIPFGSSARVDVARYTALYVDPGLPASQARTRLVPLRRLAVQRDWPPLDELSRRLHRRLGPDGSAGVLGRLIEAVDGTVDLPSPDSPGFLCGLEFTTLRHEQSFFEAHGLDLAASETRVVIDPGQVMVFDNLRTAHGRAGRRQTHELHQLCVGFREVGRAGQRTILRAFLRELSGQPAQTPGA